MESQMCGQRWFLVEGKSKQLLREPCLSPQSLLSQGCKANGNFPMVQDQAWESGSGIQEAPFPQFTTQPIAPCDLPAQGSTARSP